MTNNVKAFAAVVLGSLGPIRSRLYDLAQDSAEDLPWDDMAAHLSSLVRGASWNFDELVEHWDKLNEIVANVHDSQLAFMYLTVCDVFDALLEETRAKRPQSEF
jgi:hypothetical protein